MFELLKRLFAKRNKNITPEELRKFGSFLYRLREEGIIPVDKCPSDRRPGWQIPLVDEEHPIGSDEVVKATWGFYDLLYAMGLVGVGGGWNPIEEYKDCPLIPPEKEKELLTMAGNIARLVYAYGEELGYDGCNKRAKKPGNGKRELVYFKEYIRLAKEKGYTYFLLRND